MCVRRILTAWITCSLILALCAGSWAHAQQKPIAFVNVTLVPMNQGHVLPEQSVVVVGPRIVQTGPTSAIRLPAGALRIDGRGAFLMPGLADMHVHLIRSLDAVKSQAPSSAKPTAARTIPPLSASDDHESENRALGLLFVSNGITSVRNMWGDYAIDTFAEEIESAQVLGPHVYSTGPITDGSPYTWQGSRVVDSRPEAEEAVEQDIRAHRIALKVYNGLSADAYHWLVSSARRHDLAVVGHVPDSVGLRGVIEARQDSIEHLDGFLEALQPDPASVANATTRQLLENADMRKLTPLIGSIKAANIWNCPTLALVKNIADDAEWQRRLGLMPPAMVERYRKGMPQWHAHPEVTQQVYEFYLKIALALHERGALLLLGTDTPKPTVLPGFSLHDELQSFVRAGLTPYEALRAGTSDAAIFLHQENEFGTIGAGLRADLLLLKANPLESIDNVDKRVGVMVAGRWFTEAELQQRLLALRDSYHQ
jgi:imidazolonepropionase-like amidohydrolase